MNPSMDALHIEWNWSPSCCHGTNQNKVITSRSCQLLMMGTWLPETCWATIRREIKNTNVTSSWFSLCTLHIDTFILSSTRQRELNDVWMWVGIPYMEPNFSGLTVEENVHYFAGTLTATIAEDRREYRFEFSSSSINCTTLGMVLVCSKILFHSCLSSTFALQPIISSSLGLLLPGPSTLTWVSLLVMFYMASILLLRVIYNMHKQRVDVELSACMCICILYITLIARKLSKPDYGS